MPIPYNTADTTKIRITLLIYNALGELDDTADVDTASELQISKNNAAWVDATGTLESVGGGIFYYQGVVADADTIGPLKVKFAKSGFLTSIAEEPVESDSVSSAIEGSLTRDDLLRIAARSIAAPFTKDGTVYTVRNFDDTKDSHEMTVTGSGKISVNIIDPT